MLPDLPTALEQGLADVDADGWNAFFFPKGTPEPIVRQLNAATSSALDNPALRKRLEELGSRRSPPAERRTPEYLAKLVRRGDREMGAADQGEPESARTEGGVSGPVAEKDERAVVVAAPLELVESLRRVEAGLRRLLDHDQRAGREPAARARRGERLLGEPLAIGRIEEDQRERLDRMRRAELRGIAPEDAA